jgi:hypothetical protein
MGACTVNDGQAYSNPSFSGNSRMADVINARNGDVSTATEPEE